MGFHAHCVPNVFLKLEAHPVGNMEGQEEKLSFRRSESPGVFSDANCTTDAPLRFVCARTLFGMTVVYSDVHRSAQNAAPTREPKTRRSMLNSLACRASWTMSISLWKRTGEPSTENRAEGVVARAA